MSSITASPPIRASLLLVALGAIFLAGVIWMASIAPVAGAPAGESPVPMQGTALPTSGKIGPLVSPTPGADIQLSKSGPNSAVGGTNIDYRLDLVNLGPLSTTATITDTLDTDVTYLTYTPGATGIYCITPPTGSTAVVCQIPQFPPSTTRSLTITVRVNLNAVSPIVNNARATSPLDPIPSDAVPVYTNVNPTPTPTLTPTGAAPTPDAAECNNDFLHAYRISVGQTAMTLNFVPPAQGSCGPLPIGSQDVDYFVVHTKVGDWFQSTTTVQPGIDTYMRLYDQNNNLIAENDDIAPGNYASQLQWQSAYDGDYFLQLTDVDPGNPRGSTYTLVVSALSNAPTPTPTRTPAPGPTPVAGLDACEPNWDFDHSCVVAAGAPLTGMNFISANPGAPDNDFYRMWQKAGLSYTCETTDLAPGMDTNVIYYDSNGNGLGGNDDCTPGAFRSCISWNANYTGWIYFLVGSVVQPVPATSTYTFKCSALAPETPTATATAVPQPTVIFWTVTPPVFATQPPQATQPLPPTFTPPPPPTATAPIGILPLPTPTQSVNSVVVRVDVQIYYDGNNNQTPDAGEGIVGMRAQLVDSAGNVLDSRATGATGVVSLTAVASGDIFLEVPYLNVRVAVSGPRSTVQVRVVQQPLPGGIP